MVKFLKILFIAVCILGIFLLLTFSKKNTVPDQMSCNFYAQHCWVEWFDVICAGWDRDIILTWKDREAYIKCLIYNK